MVARVPRRRARGFIELWGIRSLRAPASGIRLRGKKSASTSLATAVRSMRIRSEPALAMRRLGRRSAVESMSSTRTSLPRRSHSAKTSSDGPGAD